MKNAMRIFSQIVIALICCSPAFSATWNGGGSDYLASTPKNWIGNVLPPYGDSIIFNATSVNNCTWDLNGTYSDLTIENGYTGTVSIISALILSSGAGCPRVTVSASPETVSNNATAAITATFRDANCNPKFGQLLSIASSGSNNRFLPDGTQTSDSAGQASWSLRSGTAEVKTIVATAVGTSMNNTTTVSFVSSGGGGIQQPGGTDIPSQMGCSGGYPTGLAPIMSCQCIDQGICNIGSPCESQDSCDNGVYSVCETTLSHSFNDNSCIPSNLSGLDPWQWAHVDQQTFRPVGVLTFELISRGETLFNNVFGWYNVTDSPPAPEDLHVIMNCNSAIGSQITLDLQNEPDYLGGKIGFFLVTPESQSLPGTCAGGDCCASVDRAAGGNGYFYYSERTYAPDWSDGMSYYHLLVYDSWVWENKFYFAWDDLFGGGNNDFTDMVTSISGIGL